VPDLFWRAVAARPPVGDPRSVSESSAVSLTLSLAWYDREVAAAVFEPVRAKMQGTDDGEMFLRSSDFVAWSIFDPRAAVTRIARLPVTPKLEPNAGVAAHLVAEMLSLSYEDRWRRIWTQYTEMRGLFERDFR
jgi:hypothetical protein